MSATTKHAIIVAGGSGERMGSRIPKQFLEIKGKPVLMHTIGAFHDYSQDIDLTVVLPEPHLITWKDLCQRYNFHIPHKLASGGATRFQSVKKGLESIQGDGLVAIHDGVRPLIDSKILERCFETAAQKDSAVAMIGLKSSIRELLPEGSKSRNRNNFCIVQTPQTFRLELIKRAYQTDELESYTDDASVWEAAGNVVNLVEGSEKNLKITTIHDLVIAEMLMNFK